jgi:hypothetical protein
MTATQAPTPGPLSGDEPLNVLLDRAVAAFKALPPEEQRRQFDEQKKNWVAAEMAWGDEGTRLCLAPTAPVEASGSEREIDLYDDRVQEGIAWTMRQWGETLGLTTWTQGDGSESVEGDVGGEIHTILVEAGLRDPETNEMAALRPQPSGETR